MYESQVNDYVRWVTELGQVHEGGYILREHPIIMIKESKIIGWQHLII